MCVCTPWGFGGAAVPGAFPQLLLTTQHPGIQGGQSLDVQPRSKEDQGHLQGDQMDAFAKLLEAHTESSDCHRGRIILSFKTRKGAGGQSNHPLLSAGRKAAARKSPSRRSRLTPTTNSAWRVCAGNGPAEGMAPLGGWLLGLEPRGKDPAAPCLRGVQASGLGPPARLAGDRAHSHIQVPTMLGRVRCTGPVHRKWTGVPPAQVGLHSPHRAATHLPACISPVSSTVWGHNDFYLEEVQPKSYLILYVINQYNDVTSLVANLMGTWGPLQETRPQSHPHRQDSGLASMWGEGPVAPPAAEG